jgi:PEP-CTERM motif
MKKHLLSTLFLAAAAGSLLAGPIEDAAPRPVVLGGSTSYDQWTNLNASANPGYPGFASATLWPSPIGSNLGGDASLNKISGQANPAGASIYGGFAGGQLQVSDSTIDLDLNTLLFQIEIGEATGIDFTVAPTLTYTTSEGTTSDVAATYTSKFVQVQNGTFDPGTGPEPIYVNLWGLQWNLNAVSAPITSYSITFTTAPHSQVYGMRLDGSDASYNFAVTPVPEPSTWAVAGLVGLVVLMRLRKKGLS